MIRLGCRERLSNSCPKSVSEKTSIQMITLIALSRLTPMKANQTTKKKGTTMNPLIQFKIRILPLLIAPALVTLTALTAAPALATPNCGVTTSNLLLPWTTCRHCARRSLSRSLARLDVQGSPDVVALHDGAWRFGRLCHPKHVSARGAQWVAHASGSQPDHRHIWSAHSLRGLEPHLYAHNLHGRPELYEVRARKDKRGVDLISAS